MERYTTLQCVRIVKTLYLNQKSMMVAIWNLQKDFGENNVSNIYAIRIYSAEI